MAAFFIRIGADDSAATVRNGTGDRKGNSHAAEDFRQRVMPASFVL